jgi:hypothetical protein
MNLEEIFKEYKLKKYIYAKTKKEIRTINVVHWLD